MKIKRNYYAKSKPRGWIHGAKLTFPVPIPPKTEGEKPKHRLMAIPVSACMVRVIVKEPTEEKHWAIGLGGTERLAIYCRIQIPELRVDEQLFLDNEDGKTLWKITLGEGHPQHGLRQLPVEQPIYDPSIRAFYRVEHMAIANPRTGEAAKYRIVMGAPEEPRPAPKKKLTITRIEEPDEAVA
jgi:hypothetical protein